MVLYNTFCNIPKSKGWEDCSTHPSPSLAWWKSLHSFNIYKHWQIHTISMKIYKENTHIKYTASTNRVLQWCPVLIQELTEVKIIHTWHHLALNLDFLVRNHIWKLPHFLHEILLDSASGSSPSPSDLANPLGKKLCRPFWTVKPTKFYSGED